ncbi:MAG: FG-GAP repeat domain-containing protein, partial [Rufibacter sp.]
MNQALKVLAFLVSCIALLPTAGRAQAPIRFQETAGPMVQKNDQPLQFPWTGGFNSPQLSSIDLNLDGQPDLFVFDRSSQRVTTFLAVQDNGQWRYQFAPQYAEAFPQDLRYFAVLRDFNCDGAPDLFTATNLGIRVYTNTSAQAGKLAFDLTHPVLFYDGTGNLLVGAEDMPAITDMDGDG